VRPSVQGKQTIRPNVYRFSMAPDCVSFGIGGVAMISTTNSQHQSRAFLSTCENRFDQMRKDEPNLEFAPEWLSME